MLIFVYEYTCAQADAPPSLAAEGRAMLSAVMEDFAQFSDVRSLHPGQDEEARFKDLAARADFALVIAPEFDDLLASRCRWVEEAGGKLLGCSQPAIQLTADKLRLAAHLRECGVPTPETWLAGPAAASAGEGVTISKPRFGAGSQSIRMVRRPEDAPPDFIVQPYVSGMAASIAFLIGQHDIVPLLPARQKLSDDGTFRYLGGVIPIADGLHKRATSLGCRAVQSVPGLSGYVGVDLVLADRPEGDAVIEINPRLTTSYIGLRQLTKCNLAAALLRCGQGTKIGHINWLPGSIDFSV
jgi:predicted ATP-grasp superfamily ATP-dependent carboligase